jgi:hypothetical protein
MAGALKLALSCLVACAVAVDPSEHAENPPGNLIKYMMDKKTSGVAPAHIKGLQAYVDHYQVAIFVRVSTADTMELIESGDFSTKSVDIHDKSSDWGPHRGTVPVDPFFSSKFALHALLFSLPGKSAMFSSS